MSETKVAYLAAQSAYAINHPSRYCFRDEQRALRAVVDAVIDECARALEMMECSAGPEWDCMTRARKEILALKYGPTKRSRNGSVRKARKIQGKRRVSDKTGVAK